MLPLFSFIPSLFGLIDKVIPDKNAAKKAKASLEMLAAKGELDLMLKQIEVNIEQAKNPSVFVSGARPAILWICGAVFGYHYLLYPILQSVAALNGFDISVLPTFDTGALWPVLGGLLGIGGMRSYEKSKGTARNSL